MATLHKPRSKLRLRLDQLTSASNSNLRSAASANLAVPSPVSSAISTPTTIDSQPPQAVSDSLFYSPEHAGMSAVSSSDLGSRPMTADSSPETKIERGGSTASGSSVGTGIDDIFSLSDQMLADRFQFVQEIGFGNWGSVWLCRPKYSSTLNSLSSQLGKRASGGGHGKVAVKLVHRSKTPTTAARVRALWAEMKIIRTLKHEPHPSIIKFEAFVITPSYALIVMEHLAQLMPVNIPEARARPYFRQLASAVGYLHERGITHNDIKPANVLLSIQDVPVLVDFGFAQKWDAGMREPFLSSISWGTPEYLDPQRSRGQPHDERASDVWSLGVTMFEILIGRTPFEADEQEQFSTAEELVVYYERTKKGKWVGDWEMTSDMEHLLKAMISPDPTARISALQTYHHPALQPQAPSIITTPHFVRTAASFIEDEPLPGPLRAKAREAEKKAAADAKRKPRSKKREPKPETGPSVLGERHTNQKIESRDEGPLDGTSGRVVAKSRKPQPAAEPSTREIRRAIAAAAAEKENQDETPTKAIKVAAHPFQAKEQTSPPRKVRRKPASSTSPQKVAARAANPTPTGSPSKGKTVKNPPPETHVSQQISSSASRLAPASDEFGVVVSTTDRTSTSSDDSKILKKEHRRSLGAAPALADVKEDNEPLVVMEVEKLAPVREDAERTTESPSEAPPKSPPNLGESFPHIREDSPLATLRDNIIKSDHDKSVRFRTASGNLVSMAEACIVSPQPLDTCHSATQLEQAATLDNRLDRIASWVKNVEKIVEDARQALSEGREPPLPTLTIPEDLVHQPTTPPQSLRKKHQSSPDKSLKTLPSHLRTSSIQVEPSTPPKWMTLAEAEERVRLANEWLENAGTRVTHVQKKERPTMSHVMKLFGGDRSANTSRPASHATPLETVPLKSSPQTLRNHASLADLRSPTSCSRGLQNRHSESNLRLFAAVAEHPEAPLSDRQKGVYEQFLTATPGVTRQGDGWGSLTVRGRKIGKQTSMASLREKARAFSFVHDKDRERGLNALARETEMSKEDKHRSIGSNSGFFRGTSFNHSRPTTPAGLNGGVVEPHKSHSKFRGLMTSVKAAVGISKSKHAASAAKPDSSARRTECL